MSPDNLCVNKGVRRTEEVIAGRKIEILTCPQVRNKRKLFSRKVVTEKASWKHQWEGVLDAPMLGSWPSNLRFTQNEKWHLETGCWYFIGKLKINWLASVSWLSERLVSSYSFSEKQKRKIRQDWPGFFNPWYSLEGIRWELNISPLLLHFPLSLVISLWFISTHRDQILNSCL